MASCSRCHGAGSYNGETCYWCQGTGREDEKDSSPSSSSSSSTGQGSGIAAILFLIKTIIFSRFGLSCIIGGFTGWGASFLTRGILSNITGEVQPVQKTILITMAVFALIVFIFIKTKIFKPIIISLGALCLIGFIYIYLLGWAIEDKYNIRNSRNVAAEMAQGVTKTDSFKILTNNTGDGIIIKEYIGKKGLFIKGGAIVIPEEINGLPVVSVEYLTNETSWNDSTIDLQHLTGQRITSVVFPDTITHIDGRVLVGCEKLTQVTLPKDLKVIGASVFSGTALTSVEIPEGVVEVGSRAFANCKKLTTVSLSRNIQKMANDAFEGCDKLSNASIQALRNAGYTGKLAEVTTGNEIKLRDGLYVGDLVNKKPHGKGKMIYKSGNVYEGDFVNGKRQGSGIMRFADGSIYEGEYVNDKRHGMGKYTWTSGGVYFGEYVKGKEEGKGTYINSDGKVTEGIYKNGKRIRVVR